MSSLAHLASPQTAAAPARNAVTLAALGCALGGEAHDLNNDLQNDLQNPDRAAALLRSAHRHGVQPLLHRALLEENQRLAAPAWAELEENIRHNALRNLWL